MFAVPRVQAQRRARDKEELEAWKVVKDGLSPGIHACAFCRVTTDDLNHCRFLFAASYETLASHESDALLTAPHVQVVFRARGPSKQRAPWPRSVWGNVAARLVTNCAHVLLLLN